MTEEKPVKEQITPEMEQLVREQLKKMTQEKSRTTNVWTIFIGGLFGCFAPLVAIYGLIFLLTTRLSTKHRVLAIFGTVIAWFWTIVLIALIFSTRLR